MIKGLLNNVPFQAVLEPDGRGSHWFFIDESLQKSAGVTHGSTVELAIESTKEWPEPKVPADLKKALAAHDEARMLWDKITPMARWDWLHWINATKQADTRARRIEVACSKMAAGERRPCCFNRNVCTVMDVSKNGVLIGA